MRKVPRRFEQPASTTGCTNGSRWVQWGHTPYDWPHAAAAPATSLGRSTIVHRSGRTLTNSRYSRRTVTGWWSTSKMTWRSVSRITRYHAPPRSPRWSSLFRRAQDSCGITASPSMGGTSQAAGNAPRLLLVLPLLLTHHTPGCEHQCGDGRCVLKRGTRDLGRVDDARRHQILELVGLGVVAEVLVLRLLHLPDDDRRLGARILDDHPHR